MGGGDFQSYFVTEAFELADRPAGDGGAVALFEVAVAQIGEGLSGLNYLVQYNGDRVGNRHGGPVGPDAPGQPLVLAPR